MGHPRRRRLSHKLQVLSKTRRERLQTAARSVCSTNFRERLQGSKIRPALQDEGDMGKTRREFLAATAVGLVGTVVAAESVGNAEVDSITATTAGQEPGQLPAGMPPAFGTGVATGPKVSVGTFVEAEKLVQIELNKDELAQAAGSWRVNMAPLYEMRMGPR